VEGIVSYSNAPIGVAPRLISEFGARDRWFPDEPPFLRYPTLYHHGCWAAVFAGQAGTPMDWDDGKEYGELRWRERKGIFQRSRYPLDLTREIKSLRRFLGELKPENLAPCHLTDSRIKCSPEDDVHAYALHHLESPDAVYGWVLCFKEEARFRLSGLQPGRYGVTWYDPWTGDPVRRMQVEQVNVGEAGRLGLDATPALKQLRRAAGFFPEETRDHRGHDVAFKLIPMAVKRVIPTGQTTPRE